MTAYGMGKATGKLSGYLIDPSVERHAGALHLEFGWVMSSIDR